MNSSAPARLDIQAIIEKAIQFHDRLKAIKAGIQPRDFDWYPYDAWTNLFPLNDLLSADRRYLLDLIGDDPILDIGCADGALSFFLESLGCRVHAIDYPATNTNAMRGIRALKAVLKSSIEIHQVDLDTQFTLPRARYGVAFFLGILYHLKNPYYALETLARHARYCFLSTRVARFTPDKSTRFQSAPMAYLLDEREANNDATNYWIFSDAGLRRLLYRTGWEICDYMTAGNTTDSDPATWQGDERAFCLARSLATDPSFTAELLHGWHALEERSWRWTERQFSAALRIPPTASPPVLRLKFLLPGAVLERWKSLTLAAAINGVPVPGESYTESGEHVFIRRVPPAALAGETARVDFTLDHALPPDEIDQRERGLVVSFVGID